MTPEQAETLGKIKQKLDDLCVGNASEHKEIKQTQNDIYNKIDVNKTEVYQALNNRPRWNVIMWLLGGVFASLLIVASMLYNVDNRLEQHLDNARAVFQKLTGEPWTGDVKDVTPLDEKH
jgi:hypothetical protein